MYFAPGIVECAWGPATVHLTPVGTIGCRILLSERSSAHARSFASVCWTRSSADSMALNSLGEV